MKKMITIVSIVACFFIGAANAQSMVAAQKGKIIIDNDSSAILNYTVQVSNGKLTQGSTPRGTVGTSSNGKSTIEEVIHLKKRKGTKGDMTATLMIEGVDYNSKEAVKTTFNIVFDKSGSGISINENDSVNDGYLLSAQKTGQHAVTIDVLK